MGVAIYGPCPKCNRTSSLPVGPNMEALPCAGCAERTLDRICQSRGLRVTKMICQYCDSQLEPGKRCESCGAKSTPIRKSKVSLFMPSRPKPEYMRD